MSPEERAAVTRVVEDYLEGWFGGDRDKVARAIHPDLCKRSFAAPVLKTIAPADLLRTTAEGLGKKRLADAGGRAQVAIDVHDVHHGIANVTAKSAVYREYLQLARTEEGWKIVNILWGWTDGRGPG